MLYHCSTQPHCLGTERYVDVADSYDKESKGGGGGGRREDTEWRIMEVCLQNRHTKSKFSFYLQLQANTLFNSLSTLILM